ncbi:Haloalkane dehalogenase [Gracilariopsis chorda]|uniref:Haloalkane dehalogenase n=2 Tax=Gracilariopsis TaxID=2781 RepID=A0A2V3ITX5_9FLOR|nr:Haloalkane dehalogenase [Gracilariopsis chorda]QHI00056.1 haloalkane dehalogenase [Gracilariopsis lemaneiformis]|eukprot:PXF45553.1 Haloalkane dehalogenase [Gracilariopsis chorda]
MSVRCLFAVCFIAYLVSYPHSTHAARATDDPLPRFVTKKFTTIAGKRMAYVEVGVGDPIVFLHGNPTSSYLWRNIMPHLERRGRLIAPDLIGMGDSEKLDFSGPNRYTVLEHSNYLYQLLEALGVKQNVTLVVHDWGSALGFLWAFNNRRNPDVVKAIVFFEAFVTTYRSDTFPSGITDFFNQIRSPAGEELIINQNVFVEQVLPDAVIRELTAKELDEYRRPFLNAGEDRRPTLTFPRQFPIDGVPADVSAFVETYSRWLQTSSIPKLFIRGEPGLLITNGSEALQVARSFPELTEISVPGIHYLQEDSPDEIGMAIANWL